MVFEKLFVQKKNLVAEINDLRSRLIQNSELTVQVDMISEMVEEMVQTIDDCYVQTEITRG